jgi:hypothetical protein
MDISHQRERGWTDASLIISKVHEFEFSRERSVSGSQ